MTEPFDLPQRVRAWTYARQQLGGAAESPDEALRRVVAVYSSHPTAPLALLCRVRSLDAEGFSAMEQRREVVRLPAMRQSIFLTPAETAPRLFAAMRQPLAKRAGALRYAGVEWDEYERLKSRVLVLAREPVSTSTLQQELAIDGRLMTAVRVMCSEGVVLRLGSGLRSDSLRYVATEAWLGHPLEEADAAESLRWLAAAYLWGYGPARVQDFAWWSGVTLGRARAALNDSGAIDIGGGLLLPADQQAAFERVAPVEPDAIDLLPKWDAYTMGHAPDGRQRLVDDRHLTRAYSGVKTVYGATAGDGLPLVLRGGRAVASWAHRFRGNRMIVTVAPFEPDSLPAALDEHAFDAAGKVLGATSVDMTAEVARN